MKKEAPCINCERRRFDCHPGCRDYNDWKAGRQAEADKKEEIRRATPEIPRRVVVQIWHGILRGGRRR